MSVVLNRWLYVYSRQFVVANMYWNLVDVISMRYIDVVDILAFLVMPGYASLHVYPQQQLIALQPHAATYQPRMDICAQPMDTQLGHNKIIRHIFSNWNTWDTLIISSLYRMHRVVCYMCYKYWSFAVASCSIFICRLNRYRIQVHMYKWVSYEHLY